MAAAFRFGHSLVNDHLAFKDCAGNKERTLFRHLWGNPDKLYEANGIEKNITWASGRTFTECRQVN